MWVRTDTSLDIAIPSARRSWRGQSLEADQEKRKQLVSEIGKKLQQDGAGLIIYHLRGATCWQPRLKGLTTMSNSIYDGYRYEDVQLDK